MYLQCANCGQTYPNSEDKGVLVDTTFIVTVVLAVLVGATLAKAEAK